MNSFHENQTEESNNQISQESTSFDNFSQNYFQKQQLFSNQSIIDFQEQNDENYQCLNLLQQQQDYDHQSIDDNQSQIYYHIKKPRKQRRRQIPYDKKSRRRQRNTKRKPQLQSLPFSIQEDRNIIQLVQEFGPKFQKISTFFPYRSLNTIKNRFYKILRFQKEKHSDQNFQIRMNIQPEGYIQESNQTGDFLLE